MSTEHRCSRCKQTKHTEDFPHAKGVRHSWCRVCHREVKKQRHVAWHKTNPRKNRIAEDYTTADGQIICSKCNEPHPPPHYQRRGGGWCRRCRAQSETARRLDAGIKPRVLSKLENGMKLCLVCAAMKELGEFSPSKRGLGGVAYSCRACFRLRPKDKEKSRAATAAYRKKHRARHLAKHRVRMWERNNYKRVTSDGSVTDKLLKALYTTKVCHYCQSWTAKKLRTLDHCTPLARGGAHTASNLVMACLSCNASKRDKTVDEFKAYKAHLKQHCKV